MIKLTNFKDISKHLNVPAKAIAFIEGMTASTPNGKYPFGEDCHINVMDSHIKPREDRRAEAHNTYIDVQCLITGEERIYYADRSTVTPVTEYSSEKDVMFYEYDEIESVDFAAGECVILFTNEAHHPGCAVKEALVAKKAVMKVRA